MKCLICLKVEEDDFDRAIGLAADEGLNVCDSCRSDAALGRAVRRMVVHPRALQLCVAGGQWSVEEMILTAGGHDYFRMNMIHEHTEDQPEAALAAAGLMEVKE